MLYAWGLLAWVILVTHQRLNVKHSITSFFFRRSNINNTKYIKEDLYDDLFYSWLIGFTDAEGTFLINKQNENWSLVFKLSQHKYNYRLLYFIKSRLGLGIVKESNTDIFHYEISDRKKLSNIIFPIFDRYTLLTTKYYDYLKFKKAYKILEDTNLSKVHKNESIYTLIREPLPHNPISPA